MIPSMIWDVCHKIWACHGWKNGRSASSNYSKKNTSGFIFKKQTLRWCIEGESFPPGRGKTSWIHLKHRWCSMVMARNLPAGNDAILGVLGSRMPCPIWQQIFKLTNKFQLTCFFSHHFFAGETYVSSIYSCSCCFNCDAWISRVSSALHDV